MVRKEINPIHECIDGIEEASVRQAQIAPIVHTRAPSTRHGGIDRMFDGFVELLHKIMLNSQKKSRPFVKDVCNTKVEK